MNTVEVRLYATLRKYQPGTAGDEALLIKLGNRATLGDLFDELKVPKEAVAIAMVNGRHETADHPLKNGDRVGLFPAIAGG